MSVSTVQVVYSFALFCWRKFICARRYCVCMLLTHLYLNDTMAGPRSAPRLPA